LKAEGKLLTVKQKADRVRAQGMLESLVVQGLDMPSAGERKAPRPGTRVRSKAKQQTSTEEQQQQSKKADQKFAAGLSDEDSSYLEAIEKQ
jgi:translation initiation factor 5B